MHNHIASGDRKINKEHGRNRQVLKDLRPNAWTKSRRKSWEFSSLLFTVTPTALPWDFYFFKLTQPLMYFIMKVTLQCKGERRKTW